MTSSTMVFWHSSIGGPQAAGIALTDGGHIRKHKGWGRVPEAIPDTILKHLESEYNGTPFQPRMGIGHVRYATAGASDLRSAQPHYIEPSSGRIMFCSNGDVANYQELKKLLGENGVEVNTENDGELLLKLIDFYRVSQGLSLVEAVKKMMSMVRGTYSAALMTRSKLIVFRDPLGNRPYSWGRLGATFIYASETCVLDILGADCMGDVEPGQIIEHDLVTGKIEKHQTPVTRRAHCMFELIYFSRPDSIVFGEQVGTVRHRLGRLLARRHPVEAEFVSAVPDSAISPPWG
ncbi:MAG: hypothetical protein Q8Q20_05125 [bacterium]|nr:hypothetical protein [bacterium]